MTDMGIGTALRDGRRAPRGVMLPGVIVAALVLGGIASPLAFAAEKAPAASTRAHAPLGAAALAHSSVHHTSTGPGAASTATTHASSVTLSAAVVGMAADANGAGYWEAASNGGVFAAGNASYAGSMSGQPLHAPIVSIAADPATGGYWEAAADGGIFSFGAPYYGSMGGQALQAPIVGIASTPNGRGYWEVASDGGIFSFGDARFYGSMGGHALQAPIVSMAADPATGGYWEVTAAGGIFSFGAPYYGSMGGHALQAPVAGIASTPGGKGYWEVAQDGGIFSFGSAAFSGAAKVVLPATANVPPAATAVPPTTAVAPATADVPPSNPPANIPPNPAYTFEAGGHYGASTSLPCWVLGTSAWIPNASSAQCITAEVQATNAARAVEGLPAMRLPSNFSSLTAQEQLFVLTDIERVSRGEQPVAGLSSVVDAYAQAGAAAGRDPQFSFSAIASANWWGSNWVSGALNALDANYTWMYNDGYGGYNVDCPSPGAPGCWGHRDNELTSNHGGILVMGAGDVGLHTGLQSLTELLVSVQNPADVPALYYTWSDAVSAGAGA